MTAVAAQRGGSPPVAALLEIAARECRAAGLILREHRGLRVRSKTAFDHVTDADIAVEHYLRAALRTAVAGSSVVGEELAPIREGLVTWYVDPVDGTNNMARGLPLACVSIGVAVAGELVGGCVYDPFRDELFLGGRGHPLLVESDWPARGRLAAACPMVLTDLPRPGTSRPGEADFFLRLVSGADVRRLGASALALSWVAAGRADVACNLAVSAWDVAAGACLVRAGGGVYLPIGPARAGVGTAGADPVVTASGFVAAAHAGAADAGAADAGSDLFRWIAAELRAVADLRDRTAVPVEFATAQAWASQAWASEAWASQASGPEESG